MKICIKNCNLISMSYKRPKIEENVDILINDNKIIKIKKDIITDKNVKIINAKNKIVMPGLINTHAHVPMSIFRETVDGYDLQAWLGEKIWPMEDKLTKEDIYYASYLSFIEMIKTGTTTINDMYFMTEEIIKAAIKSGIRLQTTRTLMGIGSIAEAEKRIKELKYLLDNTDSKLITFNAGIHGLYTTDQKNLNKYLKFSKENGLNVHMHFCENDKEREEIFKLYNKNPLDIIEDNFKDSKLLLAHAVKLTDDEINRLSKLNVSISHCPVSNLKLGCGIANINQMFEKNINVSLGTDGQGSGCNLDLFETMKFAALMQKGSNENPKLMNAYDVLKMATVNGAKALGLENFVGVIKENMLADIIIIDMNDIKLSPINDVFSQIVYNVKSNNVDTTIINGKILMENKKLVNDNEECIISKCEQIIKRIS